MFVLLVLLSVWWSPSWVIGQNLIPNPGFEDGYTCNPLIEQAFLNDAAPWYVVAGTPDLLQTGCDDPPVWQNIDFDLYQFPDEGMASVYIAGGAGNAGGFSTEGIGVPLLQPLEAGRQYFFTMRLLAVAWDIDGVRRCVEPKHALNVYLHDGPVEIDNEQNGVVIINSTANTSVDLQFTGHSVTPDFGFREQDVKVWKDINGCYGATGGETHLALSHNFGRISTTTLPCEVVDGAEGLINLFGFQLDNVSLVEIPDRIEVEREICVGLDNAVRLDSLVPAAFRGQNTVFRWVDGFEGAARSLQQAGEYAVTVELRCVTIPLFLTLHDAGCRGRVIAANAFTPNGDGTNDEWSALVRSDYPIVDYRLSVFDRFGRSVFTTDDPGVLWRGNSRNGDLPNGAYIWQLRYTLSAFGTELTNTDSGTVLLIR